ncbi:polyphenol oxidase family protein [Sulfuriroseicoccus oceanibius]|uniref:Polyphenol oxidase family protein n=1 Tax=Sulfuriroseicoccus oceanibius TaxID=2707525 RepID=A0A6B3LCI0_9BACT|nr:polyphenol oxidase family protein [Sulfuriroseicoccus oceanibius]QQL44652.1 polyphenol oxidase family protein [Sulfuriroseicoccus oceanibius]
MRIERFAALDKLPWIEHGFYCRQPEVDVRGPKEEVMPRLWPGWNAALERQVPDRLLYTAEQVHGNAVALVNGHPLPVDRQVPGVDALVTRNQAAVLGIVVADCCAVYLVDTRTRAIGLCHSGKKGTEGNIVGEALRMMATNFGTVPEDVVAQLSPCIRQPHYEVDIATEIVAQLQAAGLPEEQVHDCGLCTASNPERYYSYRRDLGQTGRMLAVLSAG